MSKICKSCGCAVNDNANFCHSCGSAAFQESNKVNSSAYQTKNVTSNNQFMGAEEPVKKPKNKTLIAIIIVAVLIVLAVIGSVAEKTFQKQGYGNQNPTDNVLDIQDPSVITYDDNLNTSDLFDSTENYDVSLNDADENENSYVSYSKGVFDGSVYINEWADIKISLPDGFVNADETVYAASEDEKTDCGLYITAEDSTAVLYICFEKMPSFPAYTEEEYLNAVISVMKETPELEVLSTSDVETSSFAGYLYSHCYNLLNNGITDVVQEIYVRELDGYMIFVCAMGMDSNMTEDLLSQLSTVQ